jgi:hypothetical protein
LPNLMWLKPYQALEEALPKNRVEGYFYFLILPALSITLLFVIISHLS